MLYNQKKYLERGFKKSRTSRTTKLFISLFIIIIAVIPGFFILKSYAETYIDKKNNKDPQLLWEKRSYSKLIELSDTKLFSDPYNTPYLLYRGLSNYYISFQLDSDAEKELALSQSIIDLKKLIILEQNKTKGKIEYILGKAFFLKGYYYLDEALYYLNKSIELNYKADDTYYLMALSYSKLNNHEKSIEYFTKSIDNETQERDKLIIAVTYYNNKRYDKAYQYLQEVINTSKDDNIINSCQNWKARIYIEEGKYQNAIEIYQLILKQYPNSAQTHYNLGKLYESINDPVKARAEWRKALKIDPSHIASKIELLK